MPQNYAVGKAANLSRSSVSLLIFSRYMAWTFFLAWRAFPYAATKVMLMMLMKECASGAEDRRDTDTDTDTHTHTQQATI